VTNKSLTLKFSEISDSLVECGLSAGDIAFVHSGLVSLGPIETGEYGILEGLYSAFTDVIGDQGTVAVSAAFLDYGRYGTTYDIETSPVDPSLGVFSKYVADQPGAIRSVSPIAAVSAVGKNATNLCLQTAGSAFGADSPWERLLEMDAKFVFLGVDLRFMTFVHYVEHRVGVPHLYSKYYRIPVEKNGDEIQVPISAQVRYLNPTVEYRTEDFTQIFESAGLVKTVPCGRGVLRVIGARASYDYLKKRLLSNFHFLLSKTPDYVQGIPPFDGPTGPLVD
jgi:aminoglycoside 3-N-acetyltransferase